MEIQKATGIVLSRRVLGEADILCTIITKEYGKRKFIFKGLKKSKKRSQAGAEPGSILSIIYYFRESRESFIINEFDVLSYNFSLRKNLDVIYHLYFLLETVDKSTGFDDRDKPVFDLLAAGIGALSGTPFPVNLSAFFLIHLTRFHGILPRFDRCKICGSKSYSHFSFDIADLSSTCVSCKRNNRLLGSGVKDFIVCSLSRKFTAMEHSRYDPAELRNLLFYLVLFFEHYFNIEIKSKPFILSP